MKVSKAQVQENRAKIVETASALFRERGYDGVGVAELMAAAGFTHGGFYKHFGSKADLMAEAAACGFAQRLGGSGEPGLDEFIGQYLSRGHRDQRGAGCTVAALSGDAARQPEEIKATFAAGIEASLAAFQGRGAGADGQPVSREKMLDTFAHMVGALVLSRACPDDSALADDVLAVCRAQILKSLQSTQED